MGQSRMRVDSPEVTGTRFAIDIIPVSAVSSCEALVETYESGGPVLGQTTSITSVSTRQTQGGGTRMELMDCARDALDDTAGGNWMMGEWIG